MHAPLLWMVTRLRPACRAMVFWLALPLAAAPRAEELRRHYDIPAGDAAEALRRFADRSGRELFFSAPVVRGLRTQPVRGDFTPREALEKLLAGTGRVIVEDQQTGAFSITRAPPSAAAVPREPPRREGDTLRLTPFTVHGARDDGTSAGPGYGSLHEASASRVGENLRNTPSSISVILRAVIDDLGVTTIPELSRHSLTGEIVDNTSTLTGTIATYSFRGFASNYPLRDGIVWVSPLDTYNIERVELLRGPSSFLHGEAVAGGAFNQVTKKAQPRDFTHVVAMVGTEDLRRVTLDLNRRANAQFAVRVNAVAHHSNGTANFVERDMRALHLAARYGPFAHTRIDFSAETGRLHERRAQPIPRDAFSVTDRTGETRVVNPTDGGVTFLPALPAIVDLAGARRSAGRSLVWPDRSILSPRQNYYGPDSFFDVSYRSWTAEIEQRIGSPLVLEANLAWLEIKRDTLLPAGAVAGGIYRDVNATLPGGAPNPNFNELYVEYYLRRRQLNETRFGLRLAGTYSLELPWTTQRLIAAASWQEDNPEGLFLAEFVDPRSARFKGALRDEGSPAAHAANVATLSRNFFYRRFYLRDGDAARLTGFKPVSGESVFRRDPVADGANGRLIDRRFELPSYGLGVAGKYRDGRIHTLLGWRWDAFRQNTWFDYHNPVSAVDYTLPGTPRTAWDYGAHSYQAGVVVHVSKGWSLHANYAQSVGLSSGIGGPGFVPGTLRGVAQGAGADYGIRASLLDGRLEMNGTYYVTDSTRNTAEPFAPEPVLQELAAVFGAGFHPLGADTEVRRATGVEWEANAALTENWRLTGNLSSNRLRTAERFPQLRGFQERAQQRGLATPETDVFLASVPAGVPIAGFMRTRANLLTNYTFTRGAWRGVSLGGGLQYRGPAFQGAFDFDGDGRREESYAPSYVLWNLRVGYETRLAGRPVTYALNVNNVFDETFYRSLSLSSGEWGEGRSVRLSMKLEF